MFKVGQRIPCKPYDHDASRAVSNNFDGKGTVVYIHPEGRFYVVRFDFALGSFCETFYFTQAEKEEAWARGIFERPVERLLGRPRAKPKPKGIVEYDEEEIFDGNKPRDLESILGMF